MVAYQTIEIEVENEETLETFFESERCDEVWEKVEDSEPEWAIDYEESYANQALKK